MVGTFSGVFALPDVSHAELLAEMRGGFARSEERMHALEAKVDGIGADAKKMDERQRRLVADIDQAKGGIAFARWLWLALVGLAGLSVAFWGRLTG